MEPLRPANLPPLSVGTTAGESQSPSNLWKGASLQTGSARPGEEAGRLRELILRKPFPSLLVPEIAFTRSKNRRVLTAPVKRTEIKPWEKNTELGRCFFRAFPVSLLLSSKKRLAAPAAVERIFGDLKNHFA